MLLSRAIPSAAARLRRVRAGVLLAALALAAAACDDAPTEDDEHGNEVDRMVLTVGSSSVTVSSNGTVTGAPLRIPVGTSTVTAQFLRADGTADPAVTTAEFRLDASSLPAGLTYAPVAGSFSGTLTAASTLNGQTVNASFSMFHIEEGHPDFGPFPVQVRVGQ